jgi:hypothetical protein
MASVVETRPVERFSPVKDLREAVLSVLVGVGVVFLMFFTRPGLFGWRVAAYGGLAGFLIYACCRTLHRFVVEPIHQRQKLPRPVVAAIAYFFGGIAGWGLATLIAQSVGLTHFVFSAQDIGITFAVTGSLAIVIGLAFYSFGRLEGRLRENVARLKEAEFAEKELELARAIQHRLLPPPELSGEGYRIAARNLPARFVAGDFYDVFPLSDGTVGIVVADVSGKGIGASLIMASVKSVVPLVASGRSVSETLRELNRKLSGELDSREFVALACARYNPASGALELANAGLPDPYFLDSGQSVRPLSVRGPRLPLGVRPDVAYESLAVSLVPGQRVLFLTDGLPEARTPTGDPLGYEALALLLAQGVGSPAQWLDDLLERVRAATSSTLEDDWTVLLLESWRG